MNNYFTCGQSKIFYKKFGSGSTAIILIHGFAEDGDVWTEQVDFLQDHFTILIPDLPGSGKSFIDDEEWTMEKFADCIFILLQKENAGQCVMLGHSMGGYITLAFAEKYRGMLKAFGLVHSTAFADSEEKKLNRKRGIDFIEKNGAYAFIKSTTPNLFSHLFKKDHPEKIDALIEKGKSFSNKALQQYYYAMMNRADKTNILREAKCAVLFIAGKEDEAVLLKDVLQQMHLPLVSYIHILKTAAHMGMWEESENVNMAILNFVNDIIAQ